MRLHGTWAASWHVCAAMALAGAFGHAPLLAPTSWAPPNDPTHALHRRFEWRQLLFTTCYLHSIVQERRKFGAIGFNVPYEFNQSDLSACTQFLQVRAKWIVGWGVGEALSGVAGSGMHQWGQPGAYTPCALPTAVEVPEPKHRPRPALLPPPSRTCWTWTPSARRSPTGPPSATWWPPSSTAAASRTTLTGCCWRRMQRSSTTRHVLGAEGGWVGVQAGQTFEGGWGGAGQGSRWALQVRRRPCATCRLCAALLAPFLLKLGSRTSPRHSSQNSTHPPTCCPAVRRAGGAAQELRAAPQLLRPRRR